MRIQYLQKIRMKILMMIILILTMMIQILTLIVRKISVMEMTLIVKSFTQTETMMKLIRKKEHIKNTAREKRMKKMMKTMILGHLANLLESRKQHF